ncbi:MAG TPA: HDOD domain-containing protein [Bryobacteraceae bacterium]|nr:HDOD domain-containing protein [Bryobacteraceae bacterium]
MPTLTQTSYKEQLLAGMGRLPPFSPTLNRVLASLGHEDVSFSYLSELIEKDTVLAGNTLKLVNSALYSRRAEVSNIRYAVTLLGVNKLRNAVMSMSVARLWTGLYLPPGWSIKQFNLHSVAVAVLSDLIAHRMPVELQEGAFAAGLLHDLGRLLIAATLPEECLKIMSLYDSGAGSLYECERQAIGIDHAEVSVMVLVAWNLPRAIRTAVRYHHAPDDDPTPLSEGKSVRLSALLCAADAYADHLGISVTAKNTASDAPVLDRYRSLLGESVEQVSSEFEREFEAIKVFF